MRKGKITNNMSFVEMMSVMSEGNPGALTVLMQMQQYKNGMLYILLLDSLDIRGSKIWMLYSDSCDKNVGKYNRTLMALKCGAYSEEEIQGNLKLNSSIPFLDDSIKIEGVPSYNEEFGPSNEKWNEYINANYKVVAPKIHERIEEERRYEESLKNKQLKK